MREVPAVTVAVVPRETVSQVQASLENLIGSTRVPYRLVIVDGCYPKRTRRWLDDFARQHDATLLRSDRPLTPNEARNAVLGAVDTEYVVFLDDNCFVRDRWLERLLECAQETGAGIVAPLYGFRTAPTGKETVHVFALQAHVETVEGSRVVVDRHLYSGKPLDEAVAELSRTRAEAAEFHCMLVRTRIFDELGPLDEQLITAREHLDVCMRARDAGYEVWYEPAAVAVYEFPIPLPSRDRAFFVYRWSRTLTARTLDHFAETWRLDPARLGASAARSRNRGAALPTTSPRAC